MSDATGRWTISFNGEIYNYRELRKELIFAGRRFLTESDTEVLINCIAEWGEAGLSKLRGMFAFALHDNENRELWLARDPFGIKPLYWAQSGSNFWFASQARALAECAPVNIARRPAGLVGFYLWGAIPEPFTWWQGINALPAGNLVRIARNRGLQIQKAFSLVDNAFTAARAEPIANAALKSSLLESVSRHFVSDVTVGVFLSAGVDSAAILALAKEAGFRLYTVTLAFDEFKGTAEDEAPAAEETARFFGADHRTVRVTRDEFFELRDDFMSAMDQPTTDGLNTYLVSRAAASVGLKVALSGLGGDELLGGYPSFRQVPRLVSLAAGIPARSVVAKAIKRIGLPICRAFDLNPKWAASLEYSKDLESAYFLRRCLYLPDELELLVDETWSRSGLEELSSLLPSGSHSESGRGGKLSSHAEISQLELLGYMRNQPLRDTDWASMAHSLEIRVPFLDQPLLTRLAPAIASNKPPTKNDLADCLGEPITRIALRRKTGFTTPIARWLGDNRGRRRSLRPWADKVATQFRHSIAAEAHV